MPPVNVDTGTGSAPAARTHVAVETAALTVASDPGLGSTMTVRYDNFNADADATRTIVGWNEGGGSVPGYQTWPQIPGPTLSIAVQEAVSVTEPTHTVA